MADFRHYPKQKRGKELPFTHFRPSIPINWVKGYSLTQKKEILVPAFAVYMGYNRQIKEEPIFSTTTSNGLAADRNFNKATQKSIFELVERDALMITWYAKKKPPRLDPGSVTLPDFKNLFNKITEEGLNVEIFITTLDIPIPSVTVLIYSQKHRKPYASFGAATASNLERAAFKALEEAILVREVLETVNSQEKPRIRSPDLVKTFLDHAGFYAQPKYKKIWKFLLDGPIYSLDETRKMYNFPKSEDLQDLKKLIKIFKKKKMEIIQINLTNKAVRSTGFKVARVIIPELQPIDVSYKARFLDSKRLKRFIKNFLEINRFPHPLG